MKLSHIALNGFAVLFGGLSLLAQTNTFPSSGNVGIGTTSPLAKLEVNGDGIFSGFLTLAGGASSYHGLGPVVGTALSTNDLDSDRPNLGANPVLRVNYHTGISLSAHSYYGGLRFYNQGYSPNNSNPFDSTIGAALVMCITNNKVGIGTTNPTQKLSVNGTVRAKEVIVDTGWSDFVFDEGYKLKALSETEAFIKAEKHLPDIPSASEVAQQGISVGEMQAKLLAKIEELTLHQIQQEKRIERVESENQKLRAIVEGIKAP